MSDYDDIIDLPHHPSKKHPPMSPSQRAAQFSPFAALTGYEDVLEETARLTDRRVELGESEQAQLERQLARLAERIARRPRVKITYFQPDARKAGGAYVTVSGALRRLDPVNRLLVLADGRTVPLAEVAAIREEPEEGEL